MFDLFYSSLRDSVPPVREPRTNACNISKRGIRRAPQRRTNERKKGVAHNSGSPLKNVGFQIRIQNGHQLNRSLLRAHCILKYYAMTYFITNHMPPAYQ